MEQKTWSSYWTSKGKKIIQYIPDIPFPTNFSYEAKEELKHIKDKLKDKFSSEFNINTIVDETLIGGLKIQVGSQMIDSSIKNQLQTLKEKMKEVA